MSLTGEELQRWVDSHIAVGEGIDVLKNDCDIIEFMLDNCDIYIPRENRFFAGFDCRGIANSVVAKRNSAIYPLCADPALQDGIDALAYSGGSDFGHTSTVWESVIPLGIYGLRRRVSEYAEKNAKDEKTEDFYRNVLRVYDAALRWMRRTAEKARLCGKGGMADSLINLCERGPQNLYEALQTSLVYYHLQQFFDGSILRTLGRLDKLFYPYYVKEDKETADRMLLDFIGEIDRLGATANIPFALGGTDEDGNSLVNEMSYAWLDAYKKGETVNTKLHLLCSRNMPDDIIKKAFVYVREGQNSIVFMSDERVIEALEGQGVEHRDATRYHVVGCYECGGEEELTCSCNARVNIAKALELALNRGRDMLSGKLIGLENDGVFATYEELFAEFARQLSYLCACAMKLTDMNDKYYPVLHTAPVLSGTYISALEKGADLYRDCAAKYNSSSLNAIGLATATDALAAIRKAVFEDKTVTLPDFVQILKSDWQDSEYLRLLIKNRYPKYGQGDERTDKIARDIANSLIQAVCYKPNAKGGVWRLGLFSIDWRWALGEKTAASADGRHAHETLSQNASASFGADKEGASAHLISATHIDTSKTPNGVIVDIDLHASAVRGENGITMLLASLRTYFALGGFAVHYNVLDTEVLKDAKAHPEKYPNLQVRLCGWNVQFALLSEREKDEFIARSMR